MWTVWTIQVRIFFRGKVWRVHTHSIWTNLDFIFLSRFSEKNTFFLEKFRRHTLARNKSATPKNEFTLVKLDKNCIFWRYLPSEKFANKKSECKPVKRCKQFYCRYFCFPKNLHMEVFFFAGKDRTVHTHTLIFRERKKNRAEKKNTPFLLTHTIFSKEWSILNFSREN